MNTDICSHWKLKQLIQPLRRFLPNRFSFAPEPEGAPIPNKGPRRGPTSRWAQTANAIGSKAARGCFIGIA